MENVKKNYKFDITCCFVLTLSSCNYCLFILKQNRIKKSNYPTNKIHFRLFIPQLIQDWDIGDVLEFFSGSSGARICYNYNHF